jgi:hypothetical protein
VKLPFPCKLSGNSLLPILKFPVHAERIPCFVFREFFNNGLIWRAYLAGASA